MPRRLCVFVVAVRWQGGVSSMADMLQHGPHSGGGHSWHSPLSTQCYLTPREFNTVTYTPPHCYYMKSFIHKLNVLWLFTNPTTPLSRPLGRLLVLHVVWELADMRQNSRYREHLVWYADVLRPDQMIACSDHINPRLLSKLQLLTPMGCLLRLENKALHVMTAL